MFMLSEAASMIYFMEIKMLKTSLTQTSKDQQFLKSGMYLKHHMDLC